MQSTVLRRGGALSLVAALLTSLTLAACGGDSSSSDTGTSSATSPASTSAATSTGESSGASDADGAKIFAATGCASCHTLKAADSTGQVGPNLDDLKPSEAAVEQQVINGGGGMPSFKDSLSPEEIKAVSKYVADNAGK